MATCLFQNLPRLGKVVLHQRRQLVVQHDLRLLFGVWSSAALKVIISAAIQQSDINCIFLLLPTDFVTYDVNSFFFVLIKLNFPLNAFKKIACIKVLIQPPERIYKLAIDQLPVILSII